jgi:hypothetical protein
MRQEALSPLQSSVQPPMQPSMVHLPPLHGILHPPVWAQSILQVAPALQLVSQPPGMVLQSTSQVVLAAQVVLQPPAGQANEQVFPALQARSQDAVTAGSALAAQVQLESVQEQVALG